MRASKRTMGRAAAMGILTLPGAAFGGDGLRLVSWNISNYSGGRVPELQTAFYTSFEGRSMSPDVLVVQEMVSQVGVDALLGALNTAPGGPGDWVAGPFLDGPDSDSALFYRSSKVLFAGLHTLPADPGTTGAPRDVRRYDLRLVGYADLSTQLAIYSVHMKAGSASSDQQRRLIEATRIRENAETLDPAIHIVIAGDFNIQSSNQAAYQKLVASQTNNNGRFLDPIGTPGSWNNNSAFRFVHTQDPVGAGGMDDRHDQILIDASLGDGVGLEYVGQFGVPYSTTTWNDPNHSYRAWGNDGTTFDLALRIEGNAMVGPAIAQALVTMASSGGHLPVFLDLVVPAQVGASEIIDLGDVPFGSLASGSIAVGNAGDVARWGEGGIALLHYTLEGDAGIAIDAGPFSDAAGGAANAHGFVADLATNPGGGAFQAEIRVQSDDPDYPVVSVRVTGTVVGCNDADFATPLGTLDFFDVQAFLSAFAGQEARADLTGEGAFDFFDVQAFLTAMSAGCP